MRLNDLDFQHVPPAFEHLATASQGLVEVLSAIDETTDQEKRETLKAIADYHRAQVAQALEGIGERIGDTR